MRLTESMPYGAVNKYLFFVGLSPLILMDTKCLNIGNARADQSAARFEHPVAFLNHPFQVGKGFETFGDKNKIKMIVLKRPLASDRFVPIGIGQNWQSTRWNCVMRYSLRTLLLVTAGIGGLAFVFSHLPTSWPGLWLRLVVYFASCVIPCASLGYDIAGRAGAWKWANFALVAAFGLATVITMSIAVRGLR